MTSVPTSQNSNNVPQQPRLMLSVGELSADEHAADLVRALRRLHPDIVVRGMGGRHLRAAGMDTIVDAESSASVMGFSDVIKAFGKIRSAMQRLQALIDEWHPHQLIVLDYPDFNMRLAKYAQRHGVKVIYYIPPQVWAWRVGRVKQLARYVDTVLTIFPFEVDFLRAHGYARAYYVGHPLHDRIPQQSIAEAERRETLERWGLRGDDPVLAVFPGSRSGEIARHLALMNAAVTQLQTRHPQLQILINVAPSLKTEELNIPARADVHVVKADPVLVMRCSTAGLIKSGTSNLQAALCNLPFAMFYIASPFAAWIVKTFVRIREYSIVNVLRSGTVPELIQDNTSPQRVIAALEPLLFDKNARAAMQNAFREIRGCLDDGNKLSAADRAAAHISAGLNSADRSGDSESARAD